MGIIRFILALGVIIDHSSPIFGLTLSGGIPVPCFFVMSGFYMAMVLSEKYVGIKSSYWLFLSNRLIRLYPLYIIILLVTFFANLYAFKHGESPKFSLMVDLFRHRQFPIVGMVLYLFASATLLFQDLIPAIGINHGHLFFITGTVNNNILRLGYFNLVPQSWSLGSEILFYILAPIVVKQSNKRLLSIFVLCIFFRFFMVVCYRYNLYNQIIFPSIFPFFLLGIFSYRFYKSRLFEILVVQHKNKVKWSMPIFASVLCMFQWLRIYPISNFIFPIIFSFIVPFIFSACKKSKWDSYFGNLSYPMYISHLLVSMLLKVLLHNPIFHTGLSLLLFTILLSIMLIMVISKPIERFRRKRSEVEVNNSRSVTIAL